MIDLKRTMVGLAVVSWMLASQAVPSVAADGGFRIENRIFVGDQKEPASQSTTIFYEDAVYDYLEKPAEVLVFDKAQDRFVLLSTNRRMRADVPGPKILLFTEQLKRRLDEQKDPFLKFLANPTFEEQYDKPVGTLNLASPSVNYRLQTAPVHDPSVAHRYREFSDWYAQLSPILDPASRPPFVRLKLNAALDEKGLIPTEVNLTLTPKKSFWSKRISIRSEHQLTSQLSTSDVNRVAQTRQFMVIFNPVSLEQYSRSAD